MPIRQWLDRCKAVAKWLYLITGMAKWGHWLDLAHAETEVATRISYNGIDLAYQVVFSAYALLHIALAVAALIKKRKG